MKKRTIWLGLFLGLAAIGQAQDEDAYKTWMKSVAASMAEINKNAKAGTWDAVTPEAKKLETVFNQSAEFWTKKGGEDAVGWSKDAAGFAAKLSAASAAGNAADAEAALKSVSGSCRGCHTAHRDKAADGSYKIK